MMTVDTIYNYCLYHWDRYIVKAAQQSDDYMQGKADALKLIMDYIDEKKENE